MDEAQFQRWLDDYVQAWRTYDEAAIGALFSEDAKYRYHPWDELGEAVSGRAAIVAAWLAERDEPDSWAAEYHPWAIDRDRAVALGRHALLRGRRSDRGARVPQRVPLSFR